MKKPLALTTKTLGRTKRSSVENMKKLLQKQQTSRFPAANTNGRTDQAIHVQEVPPDFLPDLAAVEVTDTSVLCSFEDGRTVSFPLHWSDKLSRATSSQRQAFEFNAHFIFWDEIDEIIGVRNIVFGKQLQW